MDIHLQDTIVALATPRAHSSIAVIRISGIDSIEIVSRHTSEIILSAPSHTIHHTSFKYTDGVIIDDTLVSVFRAPRTYTGENIIEISLHGNPLIADSIIQTLISSGCRIASNGEFTKRAFINGKIDLSQAESIAAIISSTSIQNASSQIEILKGSLSKYLFSIKESILSLRAFIETEIDFSEDHLILLDRKKFTSEIQSLIQSIDSIIENFERRSIFVDEIKIAITGPPNSGKSSLLNSILQYERSIVSEIPGTTRDYIDAVIYYSGYRLKFIDTAGIHKTSDPIENAGILKSDYILSSADFILGVFDGTTQYKECIDKSNLTKESVLVINKSDLPDYKIEPINEYVSIGISAKNSSGITNLLDFLISKIEKVTNKESYLPLINIRHKECLLRCKNHLTITIDDIELPSDIIGLNLRYAADSISEITGEIYNDELLYSIFSNFCVGK